MASDETSSTVPSCNKSTTASLNEPTCTKRPLHFPTFEFPALKESNMCAESLVMHEVFELLDDMDIRDDDVYATPAANKTQQQEARRKELLLDNLYNISQAVRLYQSGDLELVDLDDSDIDSDYEDDEE